MTRVYFATNSGVALADVRDGRADVRLVMDKGPVSTVSIDPLVPDRLYATTRGKGLWRSSDRGETWAQVGKGIGRPIQSSSTVSRSDRHGGLGAIYVGTVGPALYRSTDGGDQFEEIATLKEIPSHVEWSFPPMPDTSHVQSLATDVTDPKRIFVGIEVGGIMRSEDGGRTWDDHPEGADADPHILLTHPAAPGRVYEGGGGAYAETQDAGDHWQREVDGFADDVRYFYSIETDPVDPDTVLMVCGRDHLSGHGLMPGGKLWSTLYRKRRGVGWHEIREGLPAKDGNEMGYLASDGQTPGHFFYTTTRGALYETRDHGSHWRQFELIWPTAVEGRLAVSRLSASGASQ